MTALELVIAGLIASLVTFVVGYLVRGQYDQHIPPPAPGDRDLDDGIQPPDPRTEDPA